MYKIHVANLCLGRNLTSFPELLDLNYFVSFLNNSTLYLNVMNRISFNQIFTSVYIYECQIAEYAIMEKCSWNSSEDEFYFY